MSRKFRWTVTGYNTDDVKTLDETYCIIEDGRPMLGNDFTFTIIDFDDKFSIFDVPDLSKIKLKLYDGRGNIIEETILGQVEVWSIDVDTDEFVNLKKISYITRFQNMTFVKSKIDFESCIIPRNHVVIQEED